MDDELYEEEQAPSGSITSIHLSVSTQSDRDDISVKSIVTATEVTDPKLGLPNPSFQCSSCGAKKLKFCEGHFGDIKFPCTILHPYYLSEAIQILNKICPGCKSIRQARKAKGADSVIGHKKCNGCRYCMGSSSNNPRLKFRVSTKDIFKRSAIIVEVSGALPGPLPADYWDFIPKDLQQDERSMKPNKRVLSHAQVHYLLKDVDPNFIEKFVPRADILFLNSFPVTPNCHRVTEVMHSLSNGQRLMFDELTRFYRKLVDFKGVANELGSCVSNCVKISKLNSNNSSKDLISAQQKNNKDNPSKTSGLRWIKDVVLGKRSDHCFRMVVVGDPNIKLSEIGIPSHIAQRLQVTEHLNRWNFDKLDESCSLRQMKGEMRARRKGSLVLVRLTDTLQMGDAIYRPLHDGDILLINRPPSIHQHSLIALSVKIFEMESVVSINPLICSPFRGDFDGDCLHGFVPQSVDAKVELKELVALDKQLINGQSGSNLLSLSQDSLTAAHLIMEDDVLLNRLEVQQLEMFCCDVLPPPAIIKAPSRNSHTWTGKQVFSMLLPSDFDYDFPLDSVCIRKGELISSSESSSWLRDANGNLFQNLVKHCQGKVLELLGSAQELLCEWLSVRGLSVSLSDLYLASDSCSRKNLMEEIFCGLQDAEQTCIFNQLMVNNWEEFLMGCAEENQSPLPLDVEYFCYEKQKSAALSQTVHDSFKRIFRDVQTLAYKYAGKDNSLVSMLKAGSKGNLLRLVQHSMCLGLQHSLVPLSFRIPNQLSCAAWNNQKACSFIQNAEGTYECVDSYIPSAVVESSFLTGLNPFECFVHSVTSRDSSFSGNADLPGTLTRKLMFFMRDLYTAYDGTVRNAYGNQLVQFSYDIDTDKSPSDRTSTPNGESITACDGTGGQPVGSLAACAISEAAYSALDQPISLLETSPLLNLKNILECGSRKSSAKQTMSLFLSEKLGRRRHGFEYGALEVKNHLEGLTFSDIVSTVMIIFSPQTGSQKRFSPWVTHFHICKEIVRRRRLKVHSIIDSLYARCNSAKPELKVTLRNLLITSKGSSAHTCNGDDDTLCITVAMAENPKTSSEQLDKARDLVVPFLLGTVVKGFLEVKKVDILWSDHPKVSKAIHGSAGVIYLKVSMLGKTGKRRLWSMLMDNCLRIMDMIDWSRSHPDNVHDYCIAYGIDAGWKYFLNNLEITSNDIGKNILPEHLVLVANSLSSTGEFVGLNAKGISQRIEHASVSSPFMQASFSSPGACFIKAAKSGVVDELSGSLEALAWGNTPPSGNGSQFEVLYSKKELKLCVPLDVYDMLGSQISSSTESASEMSNSSNNSVDECGAPHMSENGAATSMGFEKLERISKSVIRKYLTFNDIQKWSLTWKYILRSYEVNEKLNEADKSTLLAALYFHPNRADKMGTGVQDIKVGNHPKHENARCFMVVRADGTEEDFSYHKCVIGALGIVAPQKVKAYRSKLLNYGPV